MDRFNDSWLAIMDDVKAGVYGEWHDLRRRAEEEILRRYEEDGVEGQDIGSSDINHVLVGMIRSGEIQPVQR